MSEHAVLIVADGWSTVDRRSLDASPHVPDLMKFAVVADHERELCLHRGSRMPSSKTFSVASRALLVRLLAASPAEPRASAIAGRRPRIGRPFENSGLGGTRSDYGDPQALGIGESVS